MWQIFLLNPIVLLSLNTHLNQKFTLVQPHTRSYRSDNFCIAREVQINVTHCFPSVQEPTGMPFHSCDLFTSTGAVNPKGSQMQRTIKIVLTSPTVMVPPVYSPLQAGIQPQCKRLGREERRKHVTYYK